jgi:cytochrome oxidase Cu insertion factor (SCO1/SenC/PrrC family)
VTSRWGVLAAPEAGAAADTPGHAGHDAGASDAAPPASTPAGATLAHTARTFLVDQTGRLRLLYPQGTAPADLAADLRHLLD